MADSLADLSSRGVSIWLDDLSRGRLTGGGLTSLASLAARDHVVGVTTNPTIFAKAISGGGGAYAGPLRDLWARGTCVHEALRDLTTHDVDRPNLFIKIPAARQGLPAIAACLAEGISVNVTLIFSLARYDAVMSAFLEGLERARDAGRDLSPIASVA